jgi:hypothetical protein
MRWPWVNSNTLNILSSYKGSVSEDAVTHINERSLVFDTARYFLTKESRAFGLRVYANVEPRFSEGGYDDFLSLYVVDGKQIRPVLTQLAMRHWTYQGGGPGGTTNYTTIITNFTVMIAPTTSHGFADLLISAKTIGKKKVLTHKLRYDGKFYPFDMIDLTPSFAPKQHSSGGKSRLGGIAKRGDVRLRTLLIHGTRSVMRSMSGKTDRKSQWVVELQKRSCNIVAAVALAAKHARIMWAMLARGTEYKVAA